MLRTQFYATSLTTGDALPAASMTVYLTGTQTAAAVYTGLGSPTTNPIYADSTGKFDFMLLDGTYDLVIVSADGTDSSPSIQGFQSVDGIALEANVTALQSGQTAGLVVFSTLSALNANLNYPANTGAQVWADPTTG